MIKRISCMMLVLAFSAQALAQISDMQPFNTEGEIPTPKTREEVNVLKQQIDEIQINLSVAQHQLVSADQQRDIAMFVVLPIAAATAILAGRAVALGDAKGGWALLYKSSKDASFAVKLSNVLAKAAVVAVGVDFVYIRFLTHEQIEAAEVKINFLQLQLDKLRRAMDAVDQSLKDEEAASQALP